MSSAGFSSLNTVRVKTLFSHQSMADFFHPTFPCEKFNYWTIEKDWKNNVHCYFRHAFSILQITGNLTYCFLIRAATWWGEIPLKSAVSCPGMSASEQNGRKGNIPGPKGLSTAYNAIIFSFNFYLWYCTRLSKTKKLVCQSEDHISSWKINSYLRHLALQVKAYETWISHL